MNIYYKKIRRIVITGKKEDFKKAFDYCHKNGYRVTRSGPYPINGGFEYDISRFKIIAEKTIN